MVDLISLAVGVTVLATVWRKWFTAGAGRVAGAQRNITLPWARSGLASGPPKNSIRVSSGLHDHMPAEHGPASPGNPPRLYSVGTGAVSLLPAMLP